MSTVLDKEALAKALRDLASEVATAEDFQSAYYTVDFQTMEVPDEATVTRIVNTGWATVNVTIQFKPKRKR